MKKILFMLTIVCTVIFSIGALNVSAGSFGFYEEFTYEIENGEVAVRLNKDVSSVTIPSEINGYPVTIINDFSSSHLTNVVIPNGVKIISDFAFSGSNLTNVSIPGSVTSVGEGAFYRCASLTSVQINNGVTSIDKSAFQNCTSLTNVTIPDSVISIGEIAFSNCTNLTSVTIGNSVTSISERAFANCTNLTGVSIPSSVTAIEREAFIGCSSLVSLNIPDSVSSIGVNAFQMCKNLKSIELPNGITSINDGLFDLCNNLESIKIPRGITSIGNSVFSSCKNLKSVYYAGTKEQWDNIKKGTNISYLEAANIIFNYNPITVTYNGERINFDQDPIIENDRTLVPVRAIFEKLGAEVEWNGITQTVTAKKGDITIELTINDTNAKKNGSIITLDVPAKIINNRTLVPVRFVSDCFGVGVEWDGNNKQVILTAN